MKNGFRFLGVTAAAVTVFLTAACDLAPGGKPPNGESETPLVAGTFANGDSTARFYANEVSGTGRSALRSVGDLPDTEKRLEGRIEDGDIIFSLKGVYDTESNRFLLSAGSSFLVYQIAGVLTGGNMGETLATVKVWNGEDWISHTVEVTGKEDVSVDGSVSDKQEAGVPPAWFGKWKMKPTSWTEEEEPYGVTLTAWQFIGDASPDLPAGFLNIVSLGNGRLEMIFEMQGYVSSTDPGDGDPSDIEPPEIQEPEILIFFVKIWLEEAGNGLKLTYFGDSTSETFAEADKYDTATASDENLDLYSLTRP